MKKQKREIIYDRRVSELREEARLHARKPIIRIVKIKGVLLSKYIATLECGHLIEKRKNSFGRVYECPTCEDNYMYEHLKGVE